MKILISITMLSMLWGVTTTTMVDDYLAAETKHEITKKSQEGYLGHVETDDDNQRIKMYFVTRSTNNKVKFDTYTFDYDLKFIDHGAEEVQVEKANKSYDWFNYRGKDKQVVHSVTADPTTGGKLVLKKKEVTYYYKWISGKYDKKVKTLDKVKFKDENGRKFNYVDHYDNDVTGHVIACASVQGKVKNDPYKSMKHFKLLKVNSDLKLVSEDEFITDEPVSKIFSGTIKNASINGEDAEQADWVMVFAPFKTPGKYRGEDPMNYTYVRISPDGKVKEHFTFKSKVHTWKLDKAYEKDGRVYLYGPGIAKKAEKTFLAPGKHPSMKDKGFDDFQIAAFEDSKAVFVSAVSLDEFEDKNAKPDDQRKSVEYDGGKIVINGLDITPSGDIFINAQEWNYQAMGSSDRRGNRYKDFLIFHFNKDGSLKKSYGIENPQKTGIKGVADPAQDPKFYPTKASIIQGADPGTVYWVAQYISNIERRDWSSGAYSYTSWAPRRQIRIGKIEVDNAKIHPFKVMGGEGKFYLFNNYPLVLINKGKQVVFLGEDTNSWREWKSGKYIWLGKLDPSKL